MHSTPVGARPSTLALLTLVGLAIGAAAPGGCGGDAPMCKPHIELGYSSINSDTISWQDLIPCGACTPESGSAPGATCSDASECQSFCCSCSDSVRLTKACINGACASMAQACTDTPNVCTGFQSP
jgi:hypothetical protein